MNVDSPDPKKILPEDLVGVTVVLIQALYHEQEFIRIGYYVNNEYRSEELRNEPPAEPLLDELERTIIASDPRVTRFPIDWGDGLLDGCPEPEQKEDDVEGDVLEVRGDQNEKDEDEQDCEETENDADDTGEEELGEDEDITEDEDGDESEEADVEEDVDLSEQVADENGGTVAMDVDPSLQKNFPSATTDNASRTSASPLRLL
ncbi:unnamed protein product [Mesocestoides corti]|uniref:Anti-silencing function protein 1 n=1 Tax=Mesocestoides corti TaxID=53468 RepID=A0A0R3UNZ4_MESCO|nr:unnamed protein product [Mesocestoides corti]